jgi:acetyl coenzyme A synthetase (ADP forming)-like protein
MTSLLGTQGSGETSTKSAEDVILKDGGSIRLRALVPSDRAAVGAFFRDLSPASRRHRFFGARRELPDTEIERITGGHPETSLAFAAVTEQDGRECIVGIAELALDGSVQKPHDGEGARAEFAVAVADAHQDRGIGTLLLERVATAARKAGIDELEAFVLRDNREMLEVFERSGFAIRGSGDGDMEKLVFPTAETESFLAASLERDRLAARESVRAFFEPSSVAIVGASRREGTIGHAILDNLKKSGFGGPVYAVNPSATEILGVPSFPSLSAIGKPVELVVIAVPASEVEAVVSECARVHARGVVVISSGFGEVAPEGRQREVHLRRLVRNAGMRLVGPNCMGVLNAARDAPLNATFCPVWPPEGNVSMLSQSGALGIAMLDYASKLNIGVAKFVSVGNKADVSGNDLLSYWADDPKTDVIVLYLESFGNARKFARLAPVVARKKPIVAVKSGRSAAGTRAAQSHSAALASVDVGIDALFEQAGVIRSNTLEELFDLVALLSTQPPPRGPRVGVVTNAGGPGILLADACEAHGLTLPSLSPETLEGLRRILPAQAGLSNPIDMIASATTEQYEQAMGLVGQDPNVDSLVVIYIPPLVTKPEEVARAIARGAARVPKDKPIATVFMSSKGAPPVLAEGPRGKIPSYSFPENAAISLAAALRHARFRARPPGKFVALGRERERAVRAIIERAARNLNGGRAWLSASDASSLLELAGIRLAAAKTTAPDPDAVARESESLGYPVVLKAVARGLVHKSDVGGVTIGLASREAVRDAAVRMKRSVESAGYPLEQFFVQEQLGGIEGMVGVTADPGLGPIVVAGLGGVQVELLGDAAFRLPPVSDVDARDMLDSLRAKKVFDGFRGAPPGDRNAFVDVVCRISALVETAPEIVELDLNPVKILAPGQGAVVVDARIRIGART